ncbi:hypothetical protein T484DRAFT_1868244 [Baffinella frigidus]|nr:hypothetical protein T484DRAFT_1868244 [Cryptophyta sp. CCMP2293]
MAGREDRPASADGWFCGCLPFLQSARSKWRGWDRLEEPTKEMDLNLGAYDPESDSHPLYGGKLRRVGAPTPETLAATGSEAKAAQRQPSSETKLRPESSSTLGSRASTQQASHGSSRAASPQEGLSVKPIEAELGAASV